MYGWHDGQNAAQSNVSCAANAAAAEISYRSKYYWAMAGSNDCKHLLNFSMELTGNVAGIYVRSRRHLAVTGVPGGT